MRAVNAKAIANTVTIFKDKLYFLYNSTYSVFLVRSSSSFIIFLNILLYLKFQKGMLPFDFIIRRNL